MQQEHFIVDVTFSHEQWTAAQNSFRSRNGKLPSAGNGQVIVWEVTREVREWLKDQGIKYKMTKGGTRAIRFHIADLVEATYFKLRWVG